MFILYAAADPGWGGSETDGIDLTGERQTSLGPQGTASGRNPDPAWDRGETEAEENNHESHRLGMSWGREALW